LLFRAPLFRLTVKYKETNQLPLIQLKDVELINFSDSDAFERNLSIEETIKQTLKLTRSHLEFSKLASNILPEVIKSGNANCIGYAALFNSIGNYLIEKNDQETAIKIIHLRGSVYFLGKDLHHFFDDSFFKDHDYNAVINLKNGDTILVDPSLSDYLFIDRVKSR